MITCGPNAVMATLRDRMPVILADADWPKWLGEKPATEDELMALLKPCPEEAWKSGQWTKFVMDQITVAILACHRE